MRQTSRFTLAAVLTFIGASALPAGAQVLQVPPRSTPGDVEVRTTAGLFGGQRPAGPNARQRQLTLSLNTFGGYDDNLSPQGGVQASPFTQRRSSATAGLSGNVRYVQSRPSSMLDTSGYADVNHFPSTGIQPLVGGGGNLRVTKRVFSRTDVAAGIQGDHRPTFMLGLVGSTVTSGIPAVAAPGFTEITSNSASAYGSLSQAWTARQRTGFTAAHSRNTFGEIGQRSSSGGIDHSWEASRAIGVRSSYSLSRIVSRDPDGREHEIDSHMLSAGFVYRMQISRTRTATFGAGPGVTSVRAPNALDTGRVDYLAPSGYATVRVDLWRTWAVAADWRREATVISGLTRQSFLTNAAGLSFGGDITRDMTMTVVAMYFNGAPHEGDAGSFDSVNSTAQLQYNVSRCCSIFGNYSYGRHDLRDVAAVPEGFPRRFERNATRIGMTMYLPLYGTFPAGGRRATRGLN